MSVNVKTVYKFIVTEQEAPRKRLEISVQDRDGRYGWACDCGERGGVAYGSVGSAEVASANHVR